MATLNEFAPELSVPLASIFSATVQIYRQKTSYARAAPKTPSATNLDQTTPCPSFQSPSFVCENFVTD